MATGLGARGQPRYPQSRRTLTALLVAWGLLVVLATQRNRKKVTTGQTRAAVVAAIIVALILALVGEVAPTAATGFAGILVVSMLFAGPDVLGFLTKTLPSNLITAAGGGTTK